MVDSVFVLLASDEEGGLDSVEEGVVSTSAVELEDCTLSEDDSTGGIDSSVELDSMVSVLSDVDSGIEVEYVDRVLELGCWYVPLMYNSLPIRVKSDGIFQSRFSTDAETNCISSR